MGAETTRPDFLDRDWPRLYEADPTATPYQSATWLSAWAMHLDAAGTQRVMPLAAPHAEYVGPVGPAAQDLATVAHFTTRLGQVPGWQPPLATRYHSVRERPLPAPAN